MAIFQSQLLEGRVKVAQTPPSEWQRLKSLAVQSPDGELETGVLVDEPEGCQLRPRHQARIRPFFAPGAC